MPKQTLKLDGGLVTSKDPSTLAEGELSRADDCEYREASPSIWKVRGRTKFNATAESNGIRGGRYLRFKAADDLIVAAIGTTYRKATAGTTGTFSDLVTGLTETANPIDSCAYNNKHYLMDGINRNRVVSSDGTAALHGMLANTTAPTLNTEGEASPLGIGLTAGSTLTYWIEERVKDGDTILRRSPELGDTTVTATGLIISQDFTVTRPDVKNPDATHWALFGTSTNGAFPTGAELSEVTIATTSITDPRGDTSTVDPELPTGDTYQVVTTQLAGVTQNTAKNGEPPIASTGDVFEDSIVTDDDQDGGRIRFSFPDIFDAMPATNFVRLSPKGVDDIVWIRHFVNILMVGMKSSAWKVYTLPRPEDAAFMPERVKARISGAPGSTSALGVDEFSMGRTPMICWVSRYGLIASDGASWSVLSADLDWEKTFDIGSLNTAQLRNNPKKYRLELDAWTTEGKRRAYFFHYHPSQAKRDAQGALRAKVTGPITRTARCNFMGDIAGVDFMFTGQDDGFLYVEDVGVVDNSSAGGINMVLESGEVYPNGIGDEVFLNSVHTHHSAAVNEVANARLWTNISGHDEELFREEIALDRREATATYHELRAEAIRVGVDSDTTTGPFSVNHITLIVDDASGTPT